MTGGWRELKAVCFEFIALLPGFNRAALATSEMLLNLRGKANLIGAFPHLALFRRCWLELR
jgi:hypothetical protein